MSRLRFKGINESLGIEVLRAHRDRYLTRLGMNLAVVMSVLLFVVVEEEEEEGESECVYV